MDILAPVALGAALLVGGTASGYAHWKAYTLYRSLGELRKDVDFHSLLVWILSSPGYAKWRLGEGQIGAFDRLPDDVLAQMPAARRQTQLAKRFYFAAVAVCAVLFISLLFR